MSAVKPLDTKIRDVRARLSEVRALGDELLIDFYETELDRLYDQKIDAETKVRA